MRGRGRGTSDVEFIPYSFKTSQRKRGRPRKTPKKMLNETDDELVDSYIPKTTERKRGRPSITPQKMVNETDDDEDVLADFHKENSTNGPDHLVQDSGPPAIMHPVHTNVLTYSDGGEMGNPSNPTTLNAARSDSPETEGTLAKEGENNRMLNLVEKITIFYVKRPPRGAVNANNMGKKTSVPSGDNITKNILSDSSETECESSMLRSISSEYFPQPVQMNTCENDEEINVVAIANDAAINSESFDLTDVAVKIHTFLLDEEDEEGDDDEIKPTPIDPSLIDVKGYYVKPETGPLLNRILEHHGDIAKECNVRALRGCFLEKVCSVYEKLKYSSFEKIKKGEFKEMVLILDELEHMGMNVKWLKKRLDDIIDVKDFLNIYGKKSKQIKKGNDNLITLEKTSSTIRQNIAILEDEILKMKGEEEKVEKARNLVNNSLVNGLI